MPPTVVETGRGKVFLNGQNLRKCFYQILWSTIIEFLLAMLRNNEQNLRKAMLWILNIV